MGISYRPKWWNEMKTYSPVFTRKTDPPSLSFKKYTFFIVLVTAMLLYLSACDGTASISNVSDSDAPGNSIVNPEPPSDANPGFPLEEKLQNAVQHIHEIGLSGGKIILDGDMENIYGEMIYLCHDDKYNYYIQSNDFHVSGASLSDLDALYSIEQDALEKNEYILKARELAAVLFPYMDMAYLNFTPYYDIDPIGSVSFHIIEKREDCLINSGTLDLSKNGTLMSFSSSSYSFVDFRDSYNLTKDEICESAFRELLELKKVVEASEGYDPGAEYGIFGLPPRDGWDLFEILMMTARKLLSRRLKCI